MELHSFRRTRTSVVFIAELLITIPNKLLPALALAGGENANARFRRDSTVMLLLSVRAARSTISPRRRRRKALNGRGEELRMELGSFRFWTGERGVVEDGGRLEFGRGSKLRASLFEALAEWRGLDAVRLVWHAVHDWIGGFLVLR